MVAHKKFCCRNTEIGVRPAGRQDRPGVRAEPLRRSAHMRSASPTSTASVRLRGTPRLHRAHQSGPDKPGTPRGIADRLAVPRAAGTLRAQRAGGRGQGGRRCDRADPRGARRRNIYTLIQTLDVSAKAPMLGQVTPLGGPLVAPRNAMECRPDRAGSALGTISSTAKPTITPAPARSARGCASRFWQWGRNGKAFRRTDTLRANSSLSVPAGAPTICECPGRACEPGHIKILLLGS
jgi:hypothetical protein